MENSKTVLSKAYIITGPTSGIGYATALELAKHGTLYLLDEILKNLIKYKKPF